MIGLVEESHIHGDPRMGGGKGGREAHEPDPCFEIGGSSAIRTVEGEAIGDAAAGLEADHEAPRLGHDFRVDRVGKWWEFVWQ
jgi:hypothetical protein